MQHAIIHMQPLDARRQPIPGYEMKRNAKTVPRDGQPHQVGESWQLDPKKEMPYFCRIWADDKSIVREILAVGPEKLRHLNSITFYMDLTVLPRLQ
jgi:hypothetical protein